MPLSLRVAPPLFLQGVRFTTWGNGVQWENTASAVMAMALYCALLRLDPTDL